MLPKCSEDEPTNEPNGTEGKDENEGEDDDGLGGTSVQLPPYEPKPPQRSPAPAVFKAWRQDNYGTMMMQVPVTCGPTTSTAMIS